MVSVTSQGGSTFINTQGPSNLKYSSPVILISWVAHTRQHHERNIFMHYNYKWAILDLMQNLNFLISCSYVLIIGTKLWIRIRQSCVKKNIFSCGHVHIIWNRCAHQRSSRLSLSRCLACKVSHIHRVCCWVIRVIQEGVDGKRHKVPREAFVVECRDFEVAHFALLESYERCGSGVSTASINFTNKLEVFTTLDVLPCATVICIHSGTCATTIRSLVSTNNNNNRLSSLPFYDAEVERANLVLDQVIYLLATSRNGSSYLS